MEASSLAAFDGANLGTERSTGRSTSKFRLIDVIAKRAKGLWANKVALELSVRADVTQRTAENYLAGDRAINGNALAALLMSDAGPEFLKAMVEALPPSKRAHWNREFEDAALRADLRERHARMRSSTGY